MRGEDRGIGGKRDAGERFAIHAIAHDEFGREMLRIRCAAAIAEEEHLFSCTQSGEPGIGHLLDHGFAIGELCHRIHVRADVFPELGGGVHDQR